MPDRLKIDFAYKRRAGLRADNHRRGLGKLRVQRREGGIHKDRRAHHAKVPGRPECQAYSPCPAAVCSTQWRCARLNGNSSRSIAKEVLAEELAQVREQRPEASDHRIVPAHRVMGLQSGLLYKVPRSPTRMTPTAKINTCAKSSIAQNIDCILFPPFQAECSADGRKGKSRALTFMCGDSGRTESAEGHSSGFSGQSPAEIHAAASVEASPPSPPPPLHDPFLAYG